jgi:uncharacterized membrane protein YadS
VATVDKLTRNTLIGPIVVLAGVWHGRGATPQVGWNARLRQSVPLFVIGFFAMAALRTAGAFDGWTEDVPRALATAARALILVALAGVGLGTRMATMRRIGPRPFAIGVATAALTACAALGLVVILGPFAP